MAASSSQASYPQMVNDPILIQVLLQKHGGPSSNTQHIACETKSTTHIDSRLLLVRASARRDALVRGGCLCCVLPAELYCEGVRWFSHPLFQSRPLRFLDLFATASSAERCTIVPNTIWIALRMFPARPNVY